MDVTAWYPSLRQFQRSIFYLTIVCVCTTVIVYTLTFQQKYANTIVVSSEYSLQTPNMYLGTPRVSHPAPVLLGEDVLYSKLEQDLPNLPFEFMRKHQKSKMFYKNSTCAKLPSLSQLHINNVYWQSFIATDRIFHFLGAYYDNRTLNPHKPCVRIIAMTNQMDPADNYCHFWFEGRSEPTITKVKEYLYIWRPTWGKGKKGSSQPYLITCQLPADQKLVPRAVSIVENQCDIATNLLKIDYEKTDVKGNFAVCVKGLSFMSTDISVRLIEWIELLTILGADIIYMYKLQTQPNVTKVLDFYESTKKVHVVPLTLPGFQPNHPILQEMFLKTSVLSKRHTEVLTYNDCFYRNINLYKYVVVLDIDEVIMPLGTLQTWEQLIDVVKTESNINGKEYASFFARHVYFMDNHMHNHAWIDGIPKYMHMLQHVYRSKNYTRPRDYVKTFFDTERSLLLHNHLPLACLNKLCSYPISTNHGQLNHYRQGCERSVKKPVCDDFMKNSSIDSSIWKFKKELILRTNNVIEKLQSL